MKKKHIASQDRIKKLVLTRETLSSLTNVSGAYCSNTTHSEAVSLCEAEWGPGAYKPYCGPVE